MENVQEYINELVEPYKENDNAYVVTSGTTRLKCYALYIRGDKTKRGYKALLKKGSIIRTLDDFCSVSSILSRYKRRVLIKTNDIIIDNKIYCVLTEDFECTSETEAVALSALVSTVGSYSHKLMPEKKVLNKVQEAEHSITSDTSTKADSLSEVALQQVDARIDKRLKSKNIDLTYNYIESKPYIQKTLEFNNTKLNKAVDILAESPTLYITGKSGSGKTFLTKEIAGKICNIDLTNVNEDNEDFECYDNFMWVETERIDKKEFKSILAKFCMHNKGSETCLIAFNEASKTAFSGLVPFWDLLDKNGIPFKTRLQQGITFKYNGNKIELPKSLKIIASVADKDYDDQMERRLKAWISINEFSEEEYDEVSRYTGIDRKIINLLFELQSVKVNDTDDLKSKSKRTFMIPYKLKFEKIKYLDSLINSITMRFGGQANMEKVEKIKEYVEELKKNEDQQ